MHAPARYRSSVTEAKRDTKPAADDSSADPGPSKGQAKAAKQPKQSQPRQTETKQSQPKQSQPKQAGSKQAESEPTEPEQPEQPEQSELSAEDETRRKFREALERKNATPGTHPGSQVDGGSHLKSSNGKRKREFRRKSGG
jgi:hypothetical protein